jgi:uncharacterized protein
MYAHGPTHGRPGRQTVQGTPTDQGALSDGLWLAYPERLARLDQISFQAHDSIAGGRELITCPEREERRGHTSVKQVCSRKPMLAKLKEEALRYQKRLAEFSRGNVDAERKSWIIQLRLRVCLLS